MATVAQLEAALMKADAAGDEAAAREIAAEIKRTRTAKPAKQRPKAGRLESVVSGIERGLQPFAECAERLNPLSYIMPAEQSPATRQRLQTQARQAQQDRPNYFAGGKIAGEIAATAPLISAGGGLISAGGRALGTVAPRVAPVVQRFGQAVSSGGIGVQAPTRAGRVGLKVAGGGTAGAAGAALTGQDVTEGALFGAGIPVVGSVLKRLGGKAVDIARLPAVKAGQIIREALGKDVDAARAAFSALSPDDQRLAQQVLIDAGVEPSPFFGIGNIVAREIDPDTPAAILARQAAEREARMAGISGGETATARRGAIDVERRAVNEATGPARDAALARANIAGETVPAAEVLANAARQQADEQSGLARRMILGSERAETALGQMDDLGDILSPEAINRQRGIAGAMTQRGEAAAQEAIGLRQQARDMGGQRLRRARPIRGFHQAMGSAQPRDDFAEIEVMRAGDDGAAKPRGFQRVLPTMRHQRPANQRNPCQTIEQPQFAKRISDINRHLCPGFLPCAAPRHRQIPRETRNIRPARRMARHNYREQARMRRRQQPMRGQDDFILPRMSTGREPNRPPRPGSAEPRQFGGISR
jgi:hypothetical protein